MRLSLGSLDISTMAALYNGSKLILGTKNGDV